MIREKVKEKKEKRKWTKKKEIGRKEVGMCRPAGFESRLVPDLPLPLSPL